MKENTSIGHYRILRPLGKGGMGEVYLAEDTRLKRQVAIKILPERLRNHPERLKRFRREAEAAASLQHPNIATIFSLEEATLVGNTDDDNKRQPVGASLVGAQSSIHFIVMEYVAGKSLKDHIPDGGIEIESTGAINRAPAFFDIFLPLADALAHAHAQGRIHRDIKPANIMIAEDGTPKILDFGLARIIDPDPMQVAEESETSPALGPDDETRTMDSEEQRRMAEAANKGLDSLTRGGELIGTPQYMSPEQAEREETDARTDIFSFGVVMYEALTGKRPFEGKTVESVIGKIIEADPKPVTELKPVTPYTLWLAIRRCLKKDRKQRTQTAYELHAELQDVQQEMQADTVLVDAKTLPEPVPEPIAPESVPFWRQPIGVAGIAIVMLVIGLATAWLLKPVSESPLRKFAIEVDAVANPAYDGPAVSPDGRMIVYIQGTGANTTLWIRDMDAVTARELPDTEGATRPFWAPGSDYVAYFKEGTPYTLHKVAVDGGPGIPLCDLPTGFSRGGVWREDGTIVVGMTASLVNKGGMLYAVSAQGGEPTVFAEADTTVGQWGQIYPATLPGSALMYANIVGDGLNAAVLGDGAGALMIQEGTQRRVILENRGELIAFPAYSSTGHIVYQRGFPESKGIWAVPFDGTRVTGEPFQVDANGGYPTVSSDGTLVYRSDESINLPPGRLVWLDRQGREESVGELWAELWGPSLSPNGKQVAFASRKLGNVDIRLYDLSRDIPTRFTFDTGFNGNSVWSPDGRWIAYQSVANDNEIRVKAADGSGDVAALVGGQGLYLPSAWSLDGRYLVYTHSTFDSTFMDLWYATLAVTENAVTVERRQPFLRTPFNEAYGSLSPDGKYLAYMSDESGQSEVYVASFPDGGNKRQVSADGGAYPEWHPNGSELFYWEATGVNTAAPMMAVEMQGGLRPGRPRKLFDPPQGVLASPFSVSPAGQRFMAVQQGEAGAVPKTTITVVQNWIREFEPRE